VYWLDTEKLEKAFKDGSQETFQRKFTIIYYWESAENNAFICIMTAYETNDN
jgi:hypothetical protein